MPPEQLPWGRREFRKHDRSVPDRRFTSGVGGRGGFGGGDHRSREQHHHTHAPPYHHHRNHPQQQRWCSDFRSSRLIPPGHGKHGGWGTHPDDAGRDFSPFGSRYGDTNIENDNFRPFGYRIEGRYFRSNREYRGPFSQKDWKALSLEPPIASSGGSGISNDEVTNQKSVENSQTCPSNSSKGNNSGNGETCHNGSKGNNSENAHNNSSKGNSSPHLPADSLIGQPQSVVKEKIESDGGTGDEPTSSVLKSNKETAVGLMDWKLKWNRSDSLSSRGSGISRSSSSKSTGLDSVEKTVEVQLKNMMPVGLPAVVCEEPTDQAPSDDTSSRKKPRLGWGEGLAKYEKKKVEGPDDGVVKDVLAYSVSTAETMQFPSVNVLEKSPKSADGLYCTSPETLSSVACSTSPGIEEKEPIKTVNIDHNPRNLSFSPSIVSQSCCEELAFNLENFELASIANLSSSINEILQLDDPSSVETSNVRATLMNKLLVWKVNVLKALEVTEAEIDLLETEFKSLVAELRSRCPHPAASNLLRGECHSKSCEQVLAYSCMRHAPLQVVASDDEDSMSDKDKDDTACLDDDKSNVVHCHDLASVGSKHFDYEHISEAMLASNVDSLTMALGELNKLLPVQQCPLNLLAAENISFPQRDSSIIKGRFLMMKRSLLFKEKVLTLKFKVFQHFWREGRVVSVSKHRAKSHKKLDQCQTRYKKNHLSSHSRIPHSAGSSRKVPVEEVIEFLIGLLREPQIKPCRSTLKMPAMILDKGTKMMRFISNNALVEDPCAAERERSMIKPWTSGEMEIFIDKLSMFGKDFSKIASFLEHKTVADCIEFYYKNHKSESFQRAKPGVAKQSKSQSTTYMVTNGKRWNREANAASLDVLGEVSMIAANAIETQQICESSTIFLGESSSQKAPPRIFHGPLERSYSLDNNEATAADVLAGICGSLSSGEAMSSCITSSVDPVDGYHQRVTCMKRPLTPDVTQGVDDECSDESCGEMVEPTNWTDEEKSFFVQAVSSYGKDFEMISHCLRTRSVEQCKVFFSKAWKCLGLGRVIPGPSNAAVCGGDTEGGSSSDSEDACVVQAELIIANTDSDCKMEVDLPQKRSHESDIARTGESKPDFMTYGEISQPCPIDSVITESGVKDSSVADDTPVNDTQAVDFNVDSKEPSCIYGAFTSEFDVKTSVLESNSTPTDADKKGLTEFSDSTTIVESVKVEEGDNHGQQNSESSDAVKKGLADFSEGHQMNDNEGQGPILSDYNLENKKIEDGGANFTEVNVVSSTPVEVNTENFSTGYSYSSIQKDSQCQNPPLELNGFASVESSTLFSVPNNYQRHSSTNAQPDVGANVASQNHSPKVALTGPQHVSGNSLLDSVEPSHILRGYPVSVQTLQEINSDVIKHVPTELHTDFSLRKCSTRFRNEIENFPSPLPQLRMKDHHLWLQSGCLPDVYRSQPSRNGDVKLFGKILISSQEKNVLDVCNNNNNGQHHQSAGHHCQSLTLKFSGDDKAVNLDSFQSKVDCNSYPSSKNNDTSPKSFGCWDENQITLPSILPPLPDSALLLARYPTAFSNHHMQTLKFDQPPPLDCIIRNGHHPFLPTRDMNNGISDYQLLGNRELQPFIIDTLNQPQDVLFSEMQRRNGFSVVHGMQQQSAGSMVAIDVGRGVLAGGQCSGVSDPVTAIKLHYVKTQSISMQAGNVMREDNTWRSNGDVCR